MVKNSGDIALQVTNIQQAITFFKEILGKEVTKLGEEFYKVYTNEFNLYLIEGKEFNVIFEFLTENIDEYKELSLKNGCKVLKWDDVDHWVKHDSGFAFQIGNLDSLWIEEYTKKALNEISKVDHGKNE
jgi:hypothetical protein